MRGASSRLETSSHSVCKAGTAGISLLRRKLSLVLSALARRVWVAARVSALSSDRRTKTWGGRWGWDWGGNRFTFFQEVQNRKVAGLTQQTSLCCLSADFLHLDYFYRELILKNERGVIWVGTWVFFFPPSMFSLGINHYSKLL